MAKQRRRRELELLDKILLEKGELIDSETLRKRLEREFREKLRILKAESERILYHWYDEPLNAWVEINVDNLRKCLKELCGEEYLPFGRRKVVRLKVKTLLDICEGWSLAPEQLEKYKVFMRKFPVNLKSPVIVKLKTHVLNEGSISLRTKGRQLKASYCNKDPMLHYYFRSLLEKLGVTFNRPPSFDKSKGVYVTHIDATTTRILQRAGVPFGPKTITNPSLDPRIYTDPKLRKYHFQATLTEEGTTSIRVKRRRVVMRISWARSIDITDQLIDEEKEKLKEILGPERRIAVGKLSEYILEGRLPRRVLKIARITLPNLIDQEVSILNKLYRNQIKYRFVELYPERLQLSKDGRFTVLWRAYIDRPEAIDIMVRDFGVLPGTWKDERLRRQYKIYLRFRGRSLSDEELREAKREKDMIPRRMPVEWRIRKFKEIFGQQFNDEFK